jgi:hypothetical protein
MAIKFKDISCNAGRTFEAKIAGVRLTVTRHIHYAADEWVARSHPNIIDMVLLQSKDITEAQDEAVELLASRCNAVVRACK